MAYKSPPEIYAAAVDAGEVKTHAGAGKTLVAGALAGAFIGLGALFAIAVTSGLDPKLWGTVPQLLTGAAFSVGLMLVIVAGAELVTGNVPAVCLAAFRKRAQWRSAGGYLLWSTLGALLGSLLVAYFLGVKSGVLTGPDQLKRLTAIATLKGHTETDWQIFLRGIGCNWLVCLAVWMALGAQDVAGKLVAVFFPITAFVAMGFDHLVANMFFLPAARFAGVASIGWDDILRNWAFAGLGNAAGAIVFVAGAYWYLYGRTTATAPATAEVEAPAVGTTGIAPEAQAA